jgi:hypothetical protein
MVVNPDESKNEAMELVGVSVGNKPPLSLALPAAMVTTEKLGELEEDPSIIREEDKLDSINFGNFFNLGLPQVRAGQRPIHQSLQVSTENFNISNLI